MGRFSFCKGEGEDEGCDPEPVGYRDPSPSSFPLFKGRGEDLELREIDKCSASLAVFPNASQWAFESINRVILRYRQSRYVMICLRSFAWRSAKQVPVTSFGVRSYDTEIFAGADVLVRNSSRDNYYVASVHLDVVALLAA